jgi:hypothetical protein
MEGTDVPTLAPTALDIAQEPIAHVAVMLTAERAKIHVCDGSVLLHGAGHRLMLQYCCNLSDRPV